jgi:hypothetical protein
METNKYISEKVGRCNRESNCAYHYTPKQYFQDNNISFDSLPRSLPYTKPKVITPQQKFISFIPVEVFKKSLQHHSENNFIKFLCGLFGNEITNELISKYFVGTSKLWNGATVFWQIDTQGKIRTGKIMLYDATTGKRIKEPFNHINWVHKVIKQPEFELKQCLFGNHLLQDKTKHVAIAESEKTAVIASVYLPQFIWLAVGSLTNLNAEKCNVLKGRSVTLFPDLNGFEKWSNKAKELSNLARFTISDLLERKATEPERKQGFDLADYLIKFDYKEFLPETIVPETIEPELIEPETIIPLVEVQQFEPIDKLTCANKRLSKNWEQDITELENYFKTISLPTQVKPNHYSTIKNVSLFIESHFTTVKKNNGNETFLPYLNRLQELKIMLTSN